MTVGAAHYDEVPLGGGHYESFYLRAGHPDRALAVWIRYTVLKRPGSPARGSVWFTLFDHESGTPRASKTTFEPGELSTPAAGTGIEIGANRFDQGRVLGSTGDESWELSFEGDEPSFRHLPRPWMYRARLPRTKLESPHPLARFEGRVSIGGDEIELSGWRGMVGHNWGAEHAERWVWLHGSGFDGGDSQAWLDVAIGRIKIGPLTSPWVANGAISAGGERFRLGGLRPTRVSARADGCEFTLHGRDIRLRGSARAPRDDLVAWTYSDPAGGSHHALNCSIAELAVTLERAGRKPLELRTTSGGVYEIGMRESDHGVAVQPFPDP